MGQSLGLSALFDSNQTNMAHAWHTARTMAGARHNSEEAHVRCRVSGSGLGAAPLPCVWLRAWCCSSFQLPAEEHPERQQVAVEVPPGALPPILEAQMELLVPGSWAGPAVSIPGIRGGVNRCRSSLSFQFLKEHLVNRAMFYF